MTCEFDVHVVSKRGHISFEKDKAGRIQCYLTNEPVSEAANKELIKYIAEAVGVSLSKVTIVHGVQDHFKKIKISDHHVTVEKVMEALGLHSA